MIAFEMINHKSRSTCITMFFAQNSMRLSLS